MWKSSSIRFLTVIKNGKGGKTFTISRQNASGEIGDKNVSPSITETTSNSEVLKRAGQYLGTIFKLLGVSSVCVGGGAVGYAWYDPTFRKAFEENVPYSKKFFEHVSVYLPLSDFLPLRKELETPSLTLPNQCDDEPSDVHTSEAAGRPTPRVDVVETVKENEPIIDEKQRLKEEKKRLEAERELQDAAENAALEMSLERLVAFASDAVNSVVGVRDELATASSRHSQLLKHAMEDTIDILDKDSQWEMVSNAFRQRDELSSQVSQMTAESRSALGSLKEKISEGMNSKVTKRNKVLMSAQESYNKVSNSLRKTCNQVHDLDSGAQVLARYRELVEKGRKQFAQELESLTPDVKLGSRSHKLTTDELNGLIAHAHRRIDQLQVQLAKQAAYESQCLEQAILHQKQEDEKLAMFKVQCEAERLNDEFHLERQKWEEEADVEFERELSQQLKRQLVAHSNHIKDVLREQAREIEKQNQRDLHTKILLERQAFQTEMAGWLARLHGIEAAVEARADGDRAAHIAQELWLSCVALNAAIRHGNEDGVQWEEKLTPLRKEVDTLYASGKEYPFVNRVVGTISDLALDRGVYTEVSLMERFCRVSRVCRRVAMIEHTDTASLFNYFLSYARSLFMFNLVRAEMENDSVDMSGVDVPTVLSHAEYWLEKGDLEQAVRFMNQLTGASREVASDWLKEARLLLETRQAAYALMAFASASGLATLF